MRIFIFLITLLGLVNATTFTFPNFKQCYNKNRKSIVYFGDTKALAVSAHYAISYSKEEPKSKYIKYDPYLKLYLFYSKKRLKPVKLKSTKKLSLGEWLASMDDDSLYIGNFAKRGGGISSYFEHNSKVPTNSMIACLCCDVYGLGVGEGKFIPTLLLKRFINAKEIFYGDIGVRFSKKAGRIVVSSINPFYPQKLLKVGDIVLKINGKKIRNLENIRDIILFSKPKSKVTLEIKRGDKVLKSELRVIKRSGGGFLSDTFLESKGVFFDKNLKVIEVAKGSFAQKAGFKKGDKLLAINKIAVKDYKSVRDALSKIGHKEIELLMDRDDFQFFIKVK